MLIAATHAFSKDVGLIATFGGIGVIVNLIIVYIAIQVRGEHRANQEDLLRASKSSKKACSPDLRVVPGRSGLDSPAGAPSAGPRSHPQPAGRRQARPTEGAAGFHSTGWRPGARTDRPAGHAAGLSVAGRKMAGRPGPMAKGLMSAWRTHWRACRLRLVGHLCGFCSVA